MESSVYAVSAKDTDTLNYLFKENKIKYESIGQEYGHPEFNDLLLLQPKSPTLRAALLKAASVNLCGRNNREAEKLINHYVKNYNTSSDHNELKVGMQSILNMFLRNPQMFFDKEADYSNLLKIFNQLALTPVQNQLTNHLQLLTFIHKAVDEHTIHEFLSTLSSAQIIKQIQCAASTNQHHLLNVLMGHLNHAKIGPKLFPCIFNKELISKIHATTVGRQLSLPVNDN